jgi:hypothetical protein
MSSFKTGQQRHLQDRTAPLLTLIAAAWVLTTPPAVIAQESPGNSVPGPQGNGAQATGTVEVTFIDPLGIGEASDLQIGAPDPNPTFVGRVTVLPDGVAGGSKTGREEVPQVPASLTVTAAPRQPITITVDDVVPGAGYSLSDFRCNYNAGNDTACDGQGYTETTVASGILLVGATLTGHGNRAAGDPHGSFAVTVSYQ